MQASLLPFPIPRSWWASLMDPCTPFHQCSSESLTQHTARWLESEDWMWKPVCYHYARWGQGKPAGLTTVRTSSWTIDWSQEIRMAGTHPCFQNVPSISECSSLCCGANQGLGGPGRVHVHGDRAREQSCLHWTLLLVKSEPTRC